MRAEQYDADEVRTAARGRWGQILPALGAFPDQHLDGRHHGCPMCRQGKDCFRAFNDFAELGGVNCSKCHSTSNGDGFAALMRMNSWTFPQTIKAVAEWLNVKPKTGFQANGKPDTTRPSPPPAPPDSELRKQFSVLTNGTANGHLTTFSDAKKPITVEGLHAVDAEVVLWPTHPTAAQPCIAVRAKLSTGATTGYILRTVDGSNFPAFKGLQERKTHMLRDSQDGWVIPGGFERLARSRIVWRVEGVPDALALFPLLPDDHCVVTNICGCLACPDDCDIFKNKIVYSIGDSDEPGQRGADQFACRMLGTATTIKTPKLQFPIVKDHGPDLRDWLNDGHDFDELLEIARGACDFVSRVFVVDDDEAGKHLRAFGFVVEVKTTPVHRLINFKEVILCTSDTKELAETICKAQPAAIVKTMDINGLSGWLEQYEDAEPSQIEHQLANLVAAAPVFEVPPPPIPGDEVEILWADELAQQYPEMREYYIDGLARRGETVNIIASPKVGKSWLALGLGLSVAFGLKWLGKFWTREGKVLIVDNELHRETSADRLRRITSAMGIPIAKCHERLAVVNVRGQLTDLKKLAAQLQHPKFKDFKVIILDAWYRFQPEGSDENSNTDITALYNLLDSVAGKLDCVFIAIHHTSKGNQATKSTTDVGAGAGAQSRAADSHLTLRQHTEPGAVVVDSAVRSFAPNAPFCIQWKWPVWELAEDLDPGDIKTDKPPKKTTGVEPKRTKEEIQQDVYDTRREKLHKALLQYPEGETKNQLAIAAGLSNKDAGPIFTDMLAGKVIESCSITKGKVSHPAFRLILTRSERSERSDKTGVNPSSPTGTGGVGQTAALSLESSNLSDLPTPSDSKTFDFDASPTGGPRT